MNQHQVKFTISKNGSVQFEVLNGQGQSCTVVTKDIELQLQKNGTLIDEGKKSEYYDQSPDVTLFQKFSE